MIFFLIALISSIIGAISGIGGGVIIKPVMDALTPYDAATISFISSCCVLSMAMISVVRHAMKKTPFHKKTILLLGSGAIIGGILGNQLLTAACLVISNAAIKAIQSVCLILLLAFALIYMNFLQKKYHLAITSRVLSALIGLGLGMVSTFLGIGGGPFNIAFLCFFFGISLKEATIDSIAIIMLSQISQLTVSVASQDVGGYHLAPLFSMIPAAVAGSLIGTFINRKIRERHLIWLYNITFFAIIVLNLYNLIYILW